MKVFFGVVLCILVNSRRIESSVGTTVPVTSDEGGISQTPTSIPSTTTQYPYDGYNCTYMDPPTNISIIVGKTFANTSWLTHQTNSTCTPTHLYVICFAAEEENTYGWNWVKNSSLVNVTLDTDNVTLVYIDELSEFTNYTCNATLASSDQESEITQITFQTEKDVSSQPLNLIVHNVEETTFSITWQPPEKNPGVFLTYHIKVKNYGANYTVPNNCTVSNQNFSATNVDENFTFKDALPHYIYEVIVFAENDVGYSSSINETIITLIAASDEPREVNINDFILNADLNNITGILTWTMPCQSNGPIESFNIILEGNYSLDSSIQDFRTFSVVTNSSEKYSIVIEELMPASDYVVSVRADGDNINGSYANQTFTTEDNVPGSPIIDDVTYRGSSYIVISWSEPERNSGSITNYSVEITSLGPLYDYDPVRCPLQNKTINETLDGNIVTYNFTNGSPYYNYQISITAFTSKGPGNSSSILARTKTSVPETPVDFDFQLKEDSITGLLSWILPCKINGPIQNFTLKITGHYTENSSVVTEEYLTNVKYKNASFEYTQEVQLLEAYIYEANVWIVLEDYTHGEKATANLTTSDGYPGAPTIIDIPDTDANSFTILWDPPTTRTGKIISYQVKVQSWGPLYETQCTMDNKTVTHNISNPDIREYKFTSGLPYFNYSVSVQARTSRGFGNTTEIFLSTNQSVPENVRLTEEPKLFAATSEKYNAYVEISFEEPCYLNGPLQTFELNINGTRINFEDDIYSTKTRNHLFKYNLKPEYNYVFEITTHNEYFSNTTDRQHFVAPAGIPTFSTKPTEFHIEKGSSTATINLRKEYFNDKNGNIKYLAIILTDKNLTGGYFETWDGTNWPTVSSNETDIYYQLTRKWWNPFRDLDNVTIHIGSQTECDDSSSFCNKPLEKNKEYYLIIRLFTKNFFRNSPTIYFRTADVSKLGLILGIIFGVLIFALVGIIGFVVWRKNMMKLPPIFYHRKSSSTIVSTAIPISKFPQYCKNLENNPEKITEQYTLLAEKTKESVRMQTTVYAELTENRRKNRYTNILPYDETRVKLLIEEDDEIGSDYINASYIKGYSGKIEFIATQGPLPTTCRDFWKMIIQENVSIIVMVTQFIEQNKEKCYKYFPNNHESMTVGEDMEVRCSMELHFGTYCVRTLQVKKDATQVSVTHMQYLDWPDFNVPKGTETMLQFCYQLRERLNIEGGYVIVHCSAGVGRTGTLIAADILLQNVNAGKNIDIFNTVLELRKQRTNMVQTQKQYMYIHDLIKDCLEQSQPPGLSENLEHLYENVSVLKMKQDDDNLIAKEKETESQF